MNPDFAHLTLHFSPELVKPHPKAAPRKQRKNQTRRKAAILTDTPEKQALEKESQIKELKNRKNAAGCRKKAPTRISNKTKRRIEMEFEADNTEVFCWDVRKHMPTANQESNGYNAWTVEICPILIVQGFNK